MNHYRLEILEVSSLLVSRTHGNHTIKAHIYPAMANACNTLSLGVVIDFLNVHGPRNVFRRFPTLPIPCNPRSLL